RSRRRWWSHRTRRPRHNRPEPRIHLQRDPKSAGPAAHLAACARRNDRHRQNRAPVSELTPASSRLSLRRNPHMFRTTASLCTVALAATITAHADFGFSKTQKVTGGSMAAMAGNAANRESKSYFKGQKAAEVASDSTILMDFAAQTITTINKVQKTYKVQKFGDVAAAAGGANADMSIDVKETGQTKTINGFNAKESLVTLDLDFAVGRGPAMKMSAEIEVWRSTDVPGSAEMRAFYEK